MKKNIVLVLVFVVFCHILINLLVFLIILLFLFFLFLLLLFFLLLILFGGNKYLKMKNIFFY